MAYKINKEDVVWRDINGEIVVLNCDSGNYYLLNKTGSLIWKLIERNTTQNEVVKKIKQKYKVSQSQAAKDVGTLINHLKQESLIS